LAERYDKRHRVPGLGPFESSKEASVCSERLAADRIFINGWVRAVVPQMPGIEAIPYLTNSSIMEVNFLARHLIIVGGGVLDVMYARSPYTVIQRAMHIHPTASELIPTMPGELQPLSDGAGAPQ
jgi:pyruvate/2-oxoglutarate dehydrogenase complex dihydrolipoamide dehydrogenase (E3) component